MDQYQINLSSLTMKQATLVLHLKKEKTPSQLLESQKYSIEHITSYSVININLHLAPVFTILSFNKFCSTQKFIDYKELEHNNFSSIYSLVQKNSLHETQVLAKCHLNQTTLGSSSSVAKIGLLKLICRLNVLKDHSSSTCI